MFYSETLSGGVGVLFRDPFRRLGVLFRDPFRRLGVLFRDPVAGGRSIPGGRPEGRCSIPRGWCCIPGPFQEAGCSIPGPFHEGGCSIPGGCPEGVFLFRKAGVGVLSVKLLVYCEFYSEWVPEEVICSGKLFMFEHLQLPFYFTHVFLLICYDAFVRKCLFNTLPSIIFLSHVPCA